MTDPRAWVLGLDPGKKGGAALIPADGGPGACAIPLPYPPADDQPRTWELVAWVHVVIGAGVVRAAGLELVNSFGMGRQSAFVFGQGVGALASLCELEAWPLMRPRPVDWQRTVGATGNRKADGKVDASGPVGRLFPGVPLVLPGCRKVHDGLVDALGIAEHCRRAMSAGYPPPPAAGGALPFG